MTTSSDNKPAFLWNQLPDTLLAKVLDYMDAQEADPILKACVSPTRQGRMRGLRSYWRQIFWDAGPIESWTWWNDIMSSFLAVRFLDLGSCATDQTLASMAKLDADENNKYLPNLHTLKMRYSFGLSDRNLLMLSHGRQRKERLEYIDITFCNGISYHTSLKLRKELPNLKVLRRIPEWMQGSVQTNFENDGIHTYYADGSFSYERDTQSKGYVQRLVAWDISVGAIDDVTNVGDSLQFVDDTLATQLGEFSRYYRPGVSLLRLDSTYNTENGSSTVLVIQRKRGSYPPAQKFFRDVVSRWNLRDIPVGVNHFFYERDSVQMFESAEPPGDTEYVLVTRMQNTPLADPMPPTELVRELTKYCEDEEATRVALPLQAGGDILAQDWVHRHVLGGDVWDMQAFHLANELVTPNEH